MLHDILILILGIALLVIGGNYLTDGAVAVARRFKVSDMMIGLTVVALGSSMPDIVVCVESTIRHKTALAVGDVVGANIFDLLLVTGTMAIIRPWKPSREMLVSNLPILALASMSLWIVGNTVLFDGTADNMINRSSGLMLLSIFVIYMSSTIKNAKTETGLSSTHTSAASSSVPTPATPPKSPHPTRVLLAWCMITGGFLALVLGGNWVVDGATGIALKAGMTQGMVALTVVAIGNSLPDFVTSIVATAKGEPRLAFGNIVGSCILNILLALGISSAISPLSSDSIGLVDYLTLAGAALLLWLIPNITGSRSFTRPAGIFFVLLYLAYMSYLVLTALNVIPSIK